MSPAKPPTLGPCTTVGVITSGSWAPQAPSELKAAAATSTPSATRTFLFTKHPPVRPWNGGTKVAEKEADGQTRSWLHGAQEALRRPTLEETAWQADAYPPP